MLLGTTLSHARHSCPAKLGQRSLCRVFGDPRTTSHRILERDNVPRRRCRACILDKLTLTGWLWVAFATDLFPTWILSPLFPIDAQKYTGRWLGDSSIPVTFTHLADVARYSVQVLTTRPLPQPDIA